MRTTCKILLLGLIIALSRSADGVKGKEKGNGSAEAAKVGSSIKKHPVKKGTVEGRLILSITR